MYTKIPILDLDRCTVDIYILFQKNHCIYNFYEPWSGDVNQYCTVLIQFEGETGVKKLALLPDKVGARGRC